MEKIRFIPDGEDHPADFFVLAETKLAGRQYLLVTDSEEGDGEALILRTNDADARGAGAGKEESGPGAQAYATYEIVEDERELSAVLIMMRDSLEDLGIEIEL